MAPEEGTEYVVLQQEIVDLAGVFAGDRVEGKAWVEVGRVTAGRRAEAFELAKARIPEIKPEQVGDTERVQLVPARFWKEIVQTARQADVKIDVEGL